VADPWLKFYTTDWRADPRLKMCSIAARGLWIEAICLMHEATPYGHLLVGGQCPTDAQLAVLVGAPSDEVAALLGELESAGVFSRTKEGVIYSRKLSRMAKKAAVARNNGRKGGNPSLRKDTGNRPSDKGVVKDRDKPQKPEARDTLDNKLSNAAQAAPDPVKIMFDSGVGLLGKAGVSNARARQLLGKWRKDHGTEAVISALGAAQREGAIDPTSFIEGRLRFSRTAAATRAPDIGDQRTRADGTTVEWSGAIGGWVPVRE